MVANGQLFVVLDGRERWRGGGRSGGGEEHPAQRSVHAHTTHAGPRSVQRKKFDAGRRTKTKTRDKNINHINITSSTATATALLAPPYHHLLVARRRRVLLEPAADRVLVAARLHQVLLDHLAHQLLWRCFGLWLVVGCWF